MSSADVKVVAAGTGALVDLTAVAASSQFMVAGAGDVASLSPIGAGDIERVPMTSRTDISGTLWLAAADKGIAALTGARVVAVLLETPGVGWIVAGYPYDVPGRDAQATMPANDVASEQVVWNPTGTTLIVSAVYPLTTNGNVTVTALGDDEKFYTLLSTAGTVGGKSQALGYASADITAGTVAVTGARGWLVAASPHKAG